LEYSYGFTYYPSNTYLLTGLFEFEDQKKNIGKLITGNAGKRIACGNIELEKSEE